MRFGAAFAVSVVLTGLVSPMAAAGGVVGAPATPVATVDHVTMLTDQRAAVFVNSPAMDRVVQVQVLLPAGRDATRPTLYLLDGVGGGDESDYAESTWTLETDAVDFFADKDVNVVLPVGGTGSYYTDWKQSDPVLGVNRWETFLAKELPPIIDSRFEGNGVNAVAGVSMGAAGALNLITRHPDLYAGVASYSGCADTADTPEAQFSVRRTVGFKKGDATNMWGPDGDPAWQAHNPMRNAEALRGKVVYSSVGTGALGAHDDLADPDLPLIIALGGSLEVGALRCTQQFDRRLRELNIPATFVYRPDGTHRWRYWQDDLHDSWPTLERALGR
ncbi:alpha/beta hydrolase [Rhodococcus sp. NPDC058514]|uniref:alpha/beta hydrolase n=1 Tax=unclassified Rhodococcus (in: high G+C Gram-positive bacteria) TaxID=192944 RepID=UPI003648C7D6